MQIEEPRLSRRLWHRFRRPSTLAGLGAGLLAADLLRRLLAPWTDAPALVWWLLALGLSILLLARPVSRPREQVAVLLPIAARPLCDPRLSRPAAEPGVLRQVLLFLLFVGLLVLVPALFAHGAAVQP